MSTTNTFTPFQGIKYLNLETYRKNGAGVRTPVWFASDPSSGNVAPEKLYVYTNGVSGKIKRIRNNSSVKIAPCDMRGNLTGEWIPARAEIVTGDDAAHGMKLLDRKYLPLKQILDFFAMFRRRERIVFVLRPA